MHRPNAVTGIRSAGVARSSAAPHVLQIGMWGVVVLLLLSCGPAETASRRELTVQQGEPIVYGTDDRKEFFESPASIRAIVSASMAALIPKALIAPAKDGLASSTPLLETAADLCPGEPFALEPSAAFCSAVLVDWDLVLTAGHCARVLALDDFRVVFGYYYEAKGELAFRSSDVAEPVEILAEALSPEGVDPRLDYAWLRLSGPVALPRHPVSIYVRAPDVKAGEPVVAVASSSGLPIKIDTDAILSDPRESSLDYFLASSDTSAGASGGGAFDGQRALLGVLARGGVDYVKTDAGCSATNYVERGAGQEQYTYAHRAIEGLCDGGGSYESICRADCGNPCQALQPALDVAALGGCSVARRRVTVGWRWSVGLALLAILSLRKRRSAAQSSHREAPLRATKPLCRSSSELRSWLKASRVQVHEGLSQRWSLARRDPRTTAYPPKGSGLMTARRIGPDHRSDGLTRSIAMASSDEARRRLDASQQA